MLSKNRGRLSLTALFATEPVIASSEYKVALTSL